MLFANMNFNIPYSDSDVKKTLPPNDFNYDKEYNNKWVIKIDDVQIDESSWQEKKAADEMKFFYLLGTKYNDLFYTNRNLGDFIHYLMVDITRLTNLKETKSVSPLTLQHSAYSSLSKLLNVKKLNASVLLLTRLLANNHFQNMNLFKEFERKTQNKLMMNCLDHVNQDRITFDNSSNTHDVLLDHDPLIMLSPCFQLDKYPTCEVFCAYFSNVMKSMTKQDILSLVR